MHTKKAEIVPPSAFAEPSEPSQLRPEDKPADTIRGEQEENPQLVAHNKGQQAADGRDGGEDVKESAKGGKLKEERARNGAGAARKEAERVDERKRKDGAGGFSVSAAKL
ncbi:hypothetical protein BN946_scf184866.g3 [Trametes cinnabarina]|uniref:Uncharacterized protein n=1 Tax=Pycnoporus cinnabarinus TaxID=5643 RepID=A0A060SKV4_PYCCI|nr:hypothetical protein BN946_scf184866.g3 [Trametes cinnabarina]